MPVVPGEYEFTCAECEGEGEYGVGDKEYGDFELVTCDRCYGDGKVIVDEDEAEELIELGATPDLAPAGFSED